MCDACEIHIQSVPVAEISNYPLDAVWLWDGVYHRDDIHHWDVIYHRDDTYHWDAISFPFFLITLLK